MIGLYPLIRTHSLLIIRPCVRALCAFRPETMVRDRVFVATLKCSHCTRCRGAPAHGATINSGGCTGACLHWALQFMRNCLQWSEGNPWEHWTANPRDAVTCRLICAGISDLGLGYLHWIQTDACAVVQELYERHASWAPPAHPWVPAVRCLQEVKKDYQTLTTLHERCVQLPTKVYALNLQLAEDDSWRVVLSSMNGEPVGEFIMPSHGPLNPWQHVPQSSLRIAADGNLYTFQDFVDYYGEETSHRWWARAAPCYDHKIDFLHANGDRIDGRTCQAL